MTATHTESIPIIASPRPEPSSGLGVLSVTKAATPVLLPLAGVHMAARVAERVAEVVVTETFRNPHAEPLEAVYIFPLPGGAAVRDFEMRVGARTVRGKVEERAEARQKYQKALEKGHRAALLEQERDDVFTVQVGNLPPGEEVTVRITYSERLPFFEDGTTELRLPLVVAPRYIPGTPRAGDAVGDGIEDDTDVVRDASRISPPRLAPGFNPNVDLGIEVEFLLSGAAGATHTIQDLSCSQHATRTTTADGRLTVALARADERPDRDFILRWHLAGEAIRTALLTYRDEQGLTYGMLSLVPPRRDGFLGVARDVLFVLDRSGSMEGVKMVSAARACSLLLATLGPRDRFAIEIFDNEREWLKADPAVSADPYFMRADESGLARGTQFLRGMTARGGTELDAALAEALAAVRTRRDGEDRAPVVVLLTDGQVGDESRILKRIQKEMGDARVFTVGIDTAVNEGFLRRAAALGGGTATFVEPGAPIEEALRAVGREIGHPLVVDITLADADGGAVDASSLAPSRIPDLFAGRAATVFFCLSKPGGVRVRGRFADGRSFEQAVTDQAVNLPAIAHLWARARVMDLEDRFRTEPSAQDSLRKQIVELALRHALLTRFTAYVVVDESEVVNADGTRRKIVQPVAMPALWEMEMPGAPGAGSVRAQGFILAKMAPTAMPDALSDHFGPDDAGVLAADASPAAASAGPPTPSAIKQDWMDRLAETVTDLFRKSDAEKAKGEAGDVRIEHRSLETALGALLAALADAQAEIEAGRIPSAATLEKAKADLLEILAESELGMRLTRLRRFLYTAAVELIAQLKNPSASLGSLRAFFQKYAPAVSDVRQEAIEHGLTLKPDHGPFWTASI